MHPPAAIFVFEKQLPLAEVRERKCASVKVEERPMVCKEHVSNLKTRKYLNNLRIFLILDPVFFFFPVNSVSGCALTRFSGIQMNLRSISTTSTITH